MSGTLDSILPLPSRFRGRRRAVQLASLAALVLLPALGAFRIDLGRGSLMVLGNFVNLRDFPVVAGLALVLATAPLLLVTTVGSLWCGWVCPQNTVSEWANAQTHRLLGSRASVDVDGAGLTVAPSKNHLANWAALGVRLLLVSLVLGVVPLFYFFPPDVVWSLVSLSDRSQFSAFMYRLYLVSAGAVFVDVALVRHFLCNYVCLYHIGLLLFRNSGTPHIVYDAARSGECGKCNYCRVTCLTRIDPTNIARFDRCINCAECVDACNRLQVRRERQGPGLLRFDWGRTGPAGAASSLMDRCLRAVGWHGLLFAAGCALLTYGLANLPA